MLSTSFIRRAQESQCHFIKLLLQGFGGSDLVVRLTIPKDEINRALDVAVLEVMPPFLVVQGVLGSVESHTVELGLVSVNSECHGLLSYCSTDRRRGGVLMAAKDGC